MRVLTHERGRGMLGRALPPQLRRYVKEHLASRDDALYLADSRRASRLALFVVPTTSAVNGGLLSIHHLAGLSRRIGLALDFEAFAVLADDPPGYYPRYNRGIGDSLRVLRVESLAEAISNAKSVWLHMPEYIFAQQAERLSRKLPQLNSSTVTMNILYQNREMMPSPAEIRAVQGATLASVTATAAHSAYATPAERDRLGVPLHLFSTFAAPHRYRFARLAPKRPRILVSPDNPALNETVRRLLHETHPELTFTVIQNLPYREYLRVAYTSRYSLTFGEGLDGYFVELGLAGGLPFAIFNETYFTPAFRELPNVFADIEDLLDRLPGLIDSVSDESVFARFAQLTQGVLANEYNRDRYVDNVARYYAGDIDFP